MWPNIHWSIINSHKFPKDMENLLKDLKNFLAGRRLSSMTYNVSNFYCYCCCEFFNLRPVTAVNYRLFLYIEDLRDLGTPYKWQFVEALGYSQAQARHIPGLTNLRRVTKGWVAIRLVAKKSWWMVRLMNHKPVFQLLLFWLNWNFAL